MFLKRHVRTKDGKRHVYYSLTESIRLSRRRVRQRRLFTDQETPPPEASDVCQVLLGSLSVRRPRRLGDCWLGCRLFEELPLDEFFATALAHHRGPED